MLYNVHNKIPVFREYVSRINRLNIILDFFLKISGFFDIELLLFIGAELMILLLLSIEDQNDKRTFQEMYEKTVHLFVRVAYNILHNIDDAEDIAYDTFAYFASEYSKYKRKPLDQIERIGITIVRNKCYNLLKHRKISAIPVDFNESFEKALSIEEDLLDICLKKENIENLKAAIKELSDTDRLILELRYDAMMKYSAIAKELGLSTKSVENRLYYIKNKLRTKLIG